MHQLAAYGTLRDAEILHAVTGRDLSACYAGLGVLKDWACYQIEGEVYPGIRPATGRELPLTLYQNIPEDCWQKLLAYEADEYDLQEIVLDGISYQVFISDRSEILSQQEWNLADFQLRFKQGFLGELKANSLEQKVELLEAYISGNSTRF